MNTFNNFFNLQFADTRITNNRLYLFAFSNIRRMKRNNPNGQYDQIIMDTETVMTDFRDAMVQEQLEYADRQAQTKRLEEAALKFVLAARRRASYIKGLDDTNPALYEAFFPSGLSELNRLTRSNEQQVILRFASMSQRYQNEVGPDMATEFTLLFQLYEDARLAQEDQKASVDTLKAEIAEKREVLEAQIAYNALRLGNDYYGRERFADVFFRTELLTKRKPNAQDQVAKGEIKAGVIAEILLPGGQIEDGDELVLENTGFSTLIFYRSDKPDFVDEDRGVMLLAGEQITLQAYRLGPEGNQFLTVKNVSEEIAGAYEVEVL